jgi:hypothetical protein
MDTVSYLLGKKNGGGSGTTNYNDLSNKPSINDVALSGNKTSSDLGIQEELVSGTNIKTINNQSILGSGDITISGGGDGTPIYLVGNPTNMSSIDIPLETLKAGIYKPQYKEVEIYLTKNGNRSWNIYLFDDLIIFKDYAEAEVGEIFGLIAQWDDYDGSRYRYIKKTDDSNGYSNDYTKQAPHNNNYPLVSKYERAYILGNYWRFAYYPQINNYSAPTSDNEFVPKKYVDDSISSAVGSINTVLATLTTPSNGGNA